jgi:hypothetical protein
MSICPGYQTMMPCHLWRRGIITSLHSLRILVRGDPMSCTRTIGVLLGLVNRWQRCAQFRSSPLFIRPKADGTVAMFPKETLLQSIQLNHGLPIHRSV